MDGLVEFQYARPHPAVFIFNEINKKLTLNEFNKEVQTWRISI